MFFKCWRQKCQSCQGFLELLFICFIMTIVPAHFHARYGDYQVTIEIESGVVEGEFPRRALSALLEWYQLHKEELTNNWSLAREHKQLITISPLE